MKINRIPIATLVAIISLSNSEIAFSESNQAANSADFPRYAVVSSSTIMQAEQRVLIDMGYRIYDGPIETLAKILQEGHVQDGQIISVKCEYLGQVDLLLGSAASVSCEIFDLKTAKPIFQGTKRGASLVGSEGDDIIHTLRQMFKGLQKGKSLGFITSVVDVSGEKK